MTPEERARLVVDDWNSRGGYLKSALAPAIISDLWDAVAAGIRAAIADEREACAKLAERFWGKPTRAALPGEIVPCDDSQAAIAAAIRARA